MENKSFNIFVVDDHPMNTDAYINLIQSTKPNDAFTFNKAIDCYSSYRTLLQAQKTNTPIDIALIDINVPEYREEKLMSGTDIAFLIRNWFPNCIIIMLTMHTEPLLLFDTYKKINPEGFISKNDIDFEMFPEIYSKIVNSENYISPSILNNLQKTMQDEFQWDEIDIQIVLLLNKGIPTKELPNFIAYSLSTIEKRKAVLKEILLDKKGTDAELIKKCKTLQLI
jgi:DNA-binding NarL/FixJ family response regulator